MTSTLPWRRMILHLSHIFLTEGRTFIIASFRLCVLISICYAQPQARIVLIRARTVARFPARRAFSRSADGVRHAPPHHKICTAPSRAMQKQHLFESIGDAATVEIVHGKLHRHFVAREDLDVVHAHLAEIWANILYPFSSSTLNIAFGNASRTVPSSSMTSSLVKSAPSSKWSLSSNGNDTKLLTGCAREKTSAPHQQTCWFETCLHVRRADLMPRPVLVTETDRQVFSAQRHALFRLRRIRALAKRRAAVSR